MPHLLNVFVLLCLATEVPLTMAATPRLQSVAVRGELLCGRSNADNVKARLFRVKQTKKDDLSQILDETTTSKSGLFLLQGNTNGFPLNETNMEPVLSFYHSCDVDKADKNGYRKFDIHIPKDYVTTGRIPRATYDIGKLNIQFEFPGEKRVKFEEKTKKSKI